MFKVDPLLVEKAQIALLSTAGDAPCILSGPLARPYTALHLAVFSGDEGKRLATQARSVRRLAFQESAYRVIADLSAQLGREDILVVEIA